MVDSTIVVSPYSNPSNDGMISDVVIEGTVNEGMHLTNEEVAGEAMVTEGGVYEGGVNEGVVDEGVVNEDIVHDMGEDEGNREDETETVQLSLFDELTQMAMEEGESITCISAITSDVIITVTCIDYYSGVE